MTSGPALVLAAALSAQAAPATANVVRISGATDCPSVAALARALEAVGLPMAAPAAPAEPKYELAVAVDATRDMDVEIAALASDGTRSAIERRHVGGPLSCDERADAAAVLAAAAIAGASVDAPLPEPPAPAIVVRAPARPRPTRPAPADDAPWSVGASGIGAAASTTAGIRAVFGVAVDGVHWISSRIGARGELFWLPGRDLDGYRTAGWDRAGGGVGFRIRDPRLPSLFADASLLVARTFVYGKNFSYNRQSSAFTPGVDVAFGKQWRPWPQQRLEVQIGAFFWASREVVNGYDDVGNGQQFQTSLPALDLTLRLRYAIDLGAPPS